MSPILWFFLGATVGAVVAHLADRPVRKFLLGELSYLRKELATAQDRLVHAWREPGVTIPPRPIEVKPVEKLAPALQECIDEWESPEARAAEEARIRKMLDSGWGVQAILRERENLHPT